MLTFAGKLALITGASGGLGVDFAEALARRKCNLILVARTESKLRDVQQRLTQTHGVSVEIIPLDLSLANAPTQLHARVQSRGTPVDFLINNAGLGAVGDFADTAWEKQEAILNLNIRALHHLTKLFLTGMLARNSGHILNVASVVSFFPAPHFATYAATKAYVLSLTEALSVELAATNVRVSCLCPGTTRTGFWAAAGSNGKRARQSTAMESRDVAEYGIRLLESGRTVGIPGLLNKVMVFSSRLLPRRLIAKISGAIIKE